MNSHFLISAIGGALLMALPVSVMGEQSKEFFGTFRCAFVGPVDSERFAVGDEIMVGVDGSSWLPDITEMGPIGTGDTWREDCEEVGDRLTCGGGTLGGSKAVFDERTKHFFRILYRPRPKPDETEEWVCKRFDLHEAGPMDTSKFP